MKTFINISIIAVISCILELALVKYGQFAFFGLIIIFGVFGALAWLMGHKNLGIGLIVGLVLFCIILLLFGYLFMDGWINPQDYFNRKS